MNTLPRLYLRRYCWRASGWILCCGVLLGLVDPGVAGMDYYLKIKDVPGEITEGAFTGWTRLSGLSAEVDHPPATRTTPTKADVRIHFRKEPGRLSPGLMLRCADGSMAPRMILVCMDGGKPTLRLTLSDVKIVSFQAEADKGPPTEDFGCTFRAIEWSYAERDGASGGNTAAFDIASQLGSIKPRVPFRAILEGVQREPGNLKLTCPVEAGHRYRVSGSLRLSEAWNTLHEFTAEIDGVMEVVVPRTGPLLFLRVEEVE